MARFRLPRVVRVAAEVVVNVVAAVTVLWTWLLFVYWLITR